MLLIPAIDIKNGQCVRLRQGRMDDVTVFDDDPVAVARRWIAEGADRIHVVDLDGAKAGYPVNHRVIGEIVSACGDVPVQVGGGIRDEAAIETYLERGVEFVILGTRAVSEPHFVSDAGVAFPRRIIIGLDARDGMVATDGWSKLSNNTVAEMAQQFEADGVFAIIHTDISRRHVAGGQRRGQPRAGRRIDDSGDRLRRCDPSGRYRGPAHCRGRRRHRCGDWARAL